MAIKQNNNWTSNSTQLVNQRAYSQSAGCIIGSHVGFGRGPKVNPRVAIHIEVITKNLLTLGPENKVPKWPLTIKFASKHFTRVQSGLLTERP
jgi:hypothetical protein